MGEKGNSHLLPRWKGTEGAGRRKGGEIKYTYIFWMEREVERIHDQ